jgi:hypothetical protein
MQAASEKGAAELRGKQLPPEQVERRRRTAIDEGLDRNLVLGYDGPRWTAGQIRLLGTMPDDELAAKVGRSANAVRVMRTRLGITIFKDRRRPENGHEQSE